VIEISSGTIELWDLGFSPSMAISPDPIASVNLSKSKLLEVSVSEDGLGIRVVTLQVNMTVKLGFLLQV
jgi:hypothetical protein